MLSSVQEQVLLLFVGLSFVMLWWLQHNMMCVGIPLFLGRAH